jgi:hypothetical protein
MYLYPSISVYRSYEYMLVDCLFVSPLHKCRIMYEYMNEYSNHLASIMLLSQKQHGLNALDEGTGAWANVAINKFPTKKFPGMAMLKGIQLQRPLRIKSFRPTIHSVRYIHIGFRKMSNVASTYTGKRYTKPRPDQNKRSTHVLRR